MVDPGEDFSGYMENLKVAEEANREHQKMMDDHEHWRQTTWGGWAVRQIQAAGDHFKPFVDDVAGVVSDEDSLAKVMMYTVIRIVVIFIVVGLIYALGRVLQYVIGTEIVKEEEIVIVHEYATEEEAAKARAAARQTAKRDKKEKSQ